MTDFTQEQADLLISDPVAWCSAHFGDKPWRMQREIMRACATGSRVAVKAGHGVGKTWLAARVAMWRWMTTRGAFLITTAPTYRQVNDLIWREMRRCDQIARQDGYSLAPEHPLRGAPRWDALGDGSYLAVGVSPENSDALQGYHEAELIAVIDEAAGVEPWIWESILALQPKLILAIGNPTDPDSEFAACWDDHRWQTFAIPCFESPNLTGEALEIWGKEHPALCSRAWVEEVEDRFGRDSPYYVSRVLANFPEAGEDSLIPGAWVERGIIQPPEHYEPVALGVDVAEFGGDTSVVTVWSGQILVDVIELPQANVMETAGRVKRLAEDRNAKLVAVDDTGLCGVAARLQEQGIPTMAIVPGSGAIEKERYVNLRAEMSWQYREDVREGVAKFAEAFHRLVEEGRKTKYTVTSAGKIQIEPKERIKERIGRSPDALDAAIYGWQAARELAITARRHAEKRKKPEDAWDKVMRRRPKDRWEGFR